ncbi:GntR family transcriptional regulator [Paenibacillus beijingensis]|uniref:GntR family transcriptional regulator n=1 Tax=Paenibacillus beijingensis TaxID=1126833 RepID=A0A0D5NPZ6_9BACL|nr:GntR family transcriptional regulator [Paenibacillus beijingensis]AJY77003.1 GntR family transcriptional regulator [Paenibacillus beijingensis]
MRYPASWLHGMSLGESIASELRLQIIKGSIRAGEVISENRVAAEFGTSRSPVREALKTLSNEGLIRLERMGAVVLGMSLKDIVELYDVRFIIESFAQQRLAGCNLDGLLINLNRIIDKMTLAVKHHDIVEFSYLDFSFHETIIAAANHSRIMHLWNSIRHIVLTVMLITTDEVFSEGEQKLAMVVEKHREIVSGLKSADVTVIQKVVENYFADSRKTLHNSLS